MKSLHAPMNDARPRSVGRASRHAVLRPVTPRRRRLARRLALALSAPLLAAPAAADASPIALQTTFAQPIASANRVCTAEPRALAYGTTNYNVGSALSYTSDGLPGPGYYVPANAPSWLDLEPALLAGARSDLCLGLTLPPNVEPSVIRTLSTPGDRLQDSPAWPDIAETHVVPDPPGDPAPDGDDLRGLRIDLPEGTGLGFAGQTTCAASDFDAAGYAAPSCPAGAQVGEALVRLSVWHAAQARHLALPAAKLYLLAPDAGGLPSIGLTVQPLPSLAPLKLVLRTELSPAGRLRLTADDLPRALYATSDVLGDGSLTQGAVAKPTYLESLGLRLWGSRTDHPTLAADLAASTTDCSAPAPAAIAATTYAGATSTDAPAALALSGCGGLDYDPSVTVVLDDPRPSAPTGATLTLELDGAGAGRLDARTTGATLTLPAGLRLGGQLASDGLRFCSSAAFAVTNSTPADCPEISQVGTVTLATGLADEPLRGRAFLTAPSEPGDLAGLALELAPAAATTSTTARLKFTGRLRVDDEGRLSLVFAGLPTLPADALTLTLRGGSRSLLTAPAACGTPAAEARLTPTAGNAAEVSSAVAVGTDCAEPAPSISTGIAAVTPRPGARDGLQVTLARTDRSPAITSFSAQLPEGTAADLRRVARCEQAAIEAGSCQADAALGRVELKVGVGSTPTTLSAPLQRLSAEDGALATALARVPVRLGELDLGTVDVAVALGFDTQARRLVLAATAPSAVGAWPLDLQSIGISLASGVAVNPTACRALPLSAAAQLAGGASATASSALTLDGCGSQAFAPALRAVLSGESTVGGHPRAAISVTPRDGDANLSTLTLTLPSGLAVDATRATCDGATFASGECPAATRIGSATAATSIADGAVGGTLSLVRVPGQAQPGIGLMVSGAYGFRSLATVTTVAGRQVASFADLPDLPITRLDLVLDGGATGALKIAAPVCGAGAAWRAALAAHGGQVNEATSSVACQARDAGPTVELSVKAKTGLKLKLANFGSLRLQSAKLTLSPRLRFLPPAARRAKNTAVAVIGPKTRPTFSSTSLTLTVGAGTAPKEVVARVRWPAIVASARGHRKTTFRLRLAFADGSVQVRDVLVTLPAKLPAPTPASQRAAAAPAER